MESYRSALFNERDKPRLALARTYFFDVRQDVDFGEIQDFHKTWRDFAEYLVLQKQIWDSRKGSMIKETIAVKCAKRGNDVYFWRVKKRLGFLGKIKDVCFFDSRANVKETNVIFATLTYDSKRCDLREAWEGVGDDFNRWITNLRNKYGKIGYVRTWEAFLNGYPHIHVLMVFGDRSFKTFRSGGKWRLMDKSEFDKGYHSFVDIQAVRTLRGGLFYLTKYLSKSYNEEEVKMDEGGVLKSSRRLTLALCWLFRRHSFGVSGDLLDLIRHLRNSNCFGGSLTSQLSLDGGKSLVDGGVWVFVGVFSANDLKLEYPKLDFDRSWQIELPYCAWIPRKMM